jgi:hypothetical protein
MIDEELLDAEDALMEDLVRLTIPALKRRVANLLAERELVTTAQAVGEIEWELGLTRRVLEDALDNEAVNEREVTVVLTLSEAEALLKAGNDTWVYQHNDHNLRNGLISLNDAITGIVTHGRSEY